MRDRIIKEITKLEKEKNITVLMAIESGSRAWGCASPDSDYDVRIVYKQPQDVYLAIDTPMDNIDYFLGAELDINGWDIKKTLQLIRKSNATPMEWSQSPIVYRNEDGATDMILDLAKQYFQPKHTLNHYMGIAYNSFEKGMNNGLMKLKKLFYVLRPLMAGRWIVEKGTVPPMDIPSLLEMIHDTEMLHRLEELLDIKKGVGEGYLYKPAAIELDFINELFAELKSAHVERIKAPAVDVLNEAFRAIIKD